MSKDYKKLLSILGVITAGFIVSYYAFTSYQPKILRKVEEVKGADTTGQFDFPMPSGAQRMGTNESATSRQLTFQVKKTQNELKSFYKTVFADKDWQATSEKTDNGTVILKYKNTENRATVLISAQNNEGYSTVSIEIIKR